LVRQPAYLAEPEIAVTEPLPKPWTVEDFLEWEAQQPERYEFIDGRIIGTVGGSAAHAAIKDNVTSALNVRLRGGPCRAFSEGLKIVTPAASHYPDVVVTCKPIQPTDDRIGEPVIIVEILSCTTADRDRGGKMGRLPGYRIAAGLCAGRPGSSTADLFSRNGDRWEIRVIRPPADRVKLAALDLELSLDEIYEDSGA
jgi:Uma2 family endonuclease